MTTAKGIGSSIRITGLGAVCIGNKESDAIRVALSSEKAHEMVDKLLKVHPLGIRLIADGEGILEVDGVPVKKHILSSRGHRPVVFAFDNSDSSRHVRKWLEGA